MLPRILILAGLLLVVIGFVLNPPTMSSPQQTQALSNTATLEAEAAAPALPTATPDGSFTGAGDSTFVSVEKPPLENIIWQDSFDSPDTGWEPRFDVPGTYESPRMVNWNGYENGAYIFAQNGEPTVDGTDAVTLWDFHISQRLPDYPYTIRADVSVHPAGNAMLLLDYVGDFGDINSGDGLAVVWGQTDGFAYEMVGTWPLTVYEFRAGRTWNLGCSATTKESLVGIISTAVVDVDRDVLRVRLYESAGMSYVAECRRVHLGSSDRPRALGIGAVYPRPAVPANDYNTTHFEDVFLMQPAQWVKNANPAGVVEEVLFGCDVHWMGGYSAEELGKAGIPIVNALEDRTLCANRYASYASDFPGYGPVRVAFTQMDEIEGSWYCGSEAPTSRFSFYRENDYLRALIDDRVFYVFAATNIIPHARGHVESDVVPFGYMVRSSPSGGDPQTFQSVPFVSIGHGIGVHDEMRYYFTYQDAVIRPNWTPRECFKQ